MFQLGDVILQKQRTTPYTSDSGKVIDCDAHFFNEWGLRVEELPLVLRGSAKELYKNTWYDEDGDEEYVPDELPMESYELELTLGTYNGVEKVIDFIDYLRLGGEFMMYFPDREFGVRDVRYKNTGTDAFRFNHKARVNGADTELTLIIFKVTVVVNAPTSSVTLCYTYHGDELTYDSTNGKWYIESGGSKIYYDPDGAILK